MNPVDKRLDTGGGMWIIRMQWLLKTRNHVLVVEKEEGRKGQEREGRRGRRQTP